MKFFLHSVGPFGAVLFEKFQKTLILAFESDSALSRENETKIVKITHSVMVDEYRNAEDGECDFERAQKKIWRGLADFVYEQLFLPRRV